MRSNDAPNTSVSVTTLAVACDSSIFLSSKAKKKKNLKKKIVYKYSADGRKVQIF